MMTIPQVYTDFNALPGAKPREGTPEVEMPITGFGTLQSLASQRICLMEGMLLLLYEPNDIQCEAFAHFDDHLVNAAGGLGGWVAVLDPANICTSTLPWPSDQHPCLSCGTDLRALRQSYFEHCPHCGASVMLPMAAPR